MEYLVQKGLILMTCFACLQQVKAQRKDSIVVGMYIDPVTKDTFPSVNLRPLYLQGEALPKWKKYLKEWTRLKNAVYVTYPYAMRASAVMAEINKELVGVKDPVKRKEIIHSHENDMKREFTSKLKDLSVYQGKVLMKLIKRETGANCYEIVQEYKGDVSAVFWQGIAIVFGSSLKQEYDPLGDDQAMEAIVQEVERMRGGH